MHREGRGADRGRGLQGILLAIHGFCYQNEADLHMRQGAARAHNSSKNQAKSAGLNLPPGVSFVVP
jgi:hypothetical protein